MANNQVTVILIFLWIWIVLLHSYTWNLLLCITTQYENKKNIIVHQEINSNDDHQ